MIMVHQINYLFYLRFWRTIFILIQISSGQALNLGGKKYFYDSTDTSFQHVIKRKQNLLKKLGPS
jgi:hypothetical protein